MTIHDYIGIYFICALAVGITIFTILVTMKAFKYPSSPWYGIILTSLTAIFWPLLLIYLFYLNIQEKELKSKNKMIYQKYRNIIQEWDISIEIKSNAFMLLKNLYANPDRIYPTGRDTIQFEWEIKDGSYMEFEIYKNDVNCLIVPFHSILAANKQYEKMKELSKTKKFILMDLESMNETIQDFLDGVYSDHANFVVNGE